MERIKNFRDFGNGYITTDGRQVVQGRLFRSAQLSEATTQDVKRLQKYNIETIVDFREPSERRNEPTPTWEGVTYVPHSAIGSKGQLGVALRDESDLTPFLTIAQDEFRTSYVELAFHNKAYRTMFESLLSTEGAYLHHCTAGKDRTGIGTTLIQMALGVTDEQIIHDFTLTNDYLRPYVNEWVATYEGRNREAMRALLRAYPEGIVYLLEMIDTKYPTRAHFLREQYGVTEAMRNVLRERYTVPSLSDSFHQLTVK